MRWFRAWGTPPGPLPLAHPEDKLADPKRQPLTRACLAPGLTPRAIGSVNHGQQHRGGDEGTYPSTTIC
jgi:hypothetical protein